MQFFALLYLSAALTFGALTHPMVGLTMLAAPVAAGRLS